MNLILLEAHELGADASARLADDRARHIRDILKAEPGQPLRVGLIDGGLGTATVRENVSDCVTLQCSFDQPAPPAPAVDLLLALPRPQSMKRLWPQLAAMGIRRLFLTKASRVEKGYFEARIYQPEHFRPLLLDGLQQACDTKLPAVSFHRRFKIFLEDELDGLCPDSTRLLAHPGSAPPVRDALPAAAESALLAVGPEGGWTPHELDLLQTHRFAPVSLGPRILRTDTACIALLALMGDRMTSAAQRTPRSDAPTQLD